MSQPNPYRAPQAALSGGAIPIANSALPREMLVVASGMKLILWGIVVMILAWVTWFLMHKMGESSLLALGPNATIDQEIAILMRPLYVLAGLTLLSHILNLLGLLKCAQTPEASGAKGLANIALITTLGAVVCSLANYFLQYQALKSFEVPGTIVVVLGGVASVLSIVTLFSFLFFLKKTSLYLGDALAIERSSNLIKRYIAMIVITVAIAAFFFLGAKLGLPIEIIGLVSLVLVVLLLVMAIWTFVFYIMTLNRIRTVIQAGVL